ncbi:MAG: dTDP-4-dehydrorhamnose 3,5-epimerase [Proteobacteria bacterium]|nr:dTDP-4-dehydrorhamnose 3,5-epimerase [Pseudomonadota bacterium]
MTSSPSSQGQSLEIERLSIPDVLVITPKRHRDARGFFSETYKRRELAAAGIELDFVQDNHASSPRRGTIRGLHFQIAPFEQTKLVRVTRGAIFDVALDIRQGSPSYGQHVSTIISAENWRQILVPAGFAHGYCCLDPDTEVIYKVTDYYSPDHERGVLWNDPALGIDWPVPDAEVIVSGKDGDNPVLAELPGYFDYKPMVNG